MKKLLPSTFSLQKSGFTLIELLVVITIIAILSVISLVVFTGIQPRARDATRKSDLEAVSKAMEVGYSESTGRYSDLAASMFSSKVIPKDPLDGNASGCQGNYCKYCVKGSVGNCLPTDPTVSAGQPPAATTYVVCVNLEQGSPTYICESSQR